MANGNNFQNNVEALFKGLQNFLTTKSVVGQPVPVGDSIMIPLADVSFGLAAGSDNGASRNNGGGGMGVKMSPAAVLLVGPDGSTNLVSMKSSDGMSKLIDMAPGIIDKIKDFIGKDEDSAEETPEFEE
ncbi:MAG: spore germination protein GerW family protein [Eubacteriales bacterium]|nr:spore germination protein GerW family protein [Eubacteriales bacterium]